MKLKADHLRCSGHARCHALAPEVYDTDNVEGKVVLKMSEVPPSLQGQALRGARSCPERAITAVDSATGKVLWPPTGSAK